MIRFLRKIRQELLSQNRFRKYLLYAIGEIVLVVIGILIALQINNWNENKKQQENLNSIYRIIQDDLEQNIEEASRFIANYENIRKPAFDTLLFSRLTKDTFKNDPKFLWVFGGYEDIAINTRGYDLFKNQTSALQLKDSLAESISQFYREHLIEIAVAQEELKVEFKDNGKAFKEYDWITDHFLYKNSDGYFEYLTTNPEAIRRINFYNLYYSIYVNELKSFKENGEKLVYQIDQRLK